MDSVFLYTLLFIILSALFGTYLNARAKDRCLADFAKFHVTIEEVDGDLAWGKLQIYSTGIELQYLKPHHDDDGHIETSYIIYKEQYPTLHGIFRYHDDLSKENQKRREKSIKKTYHPNLYKRILRGWRNILSTFKDSIFQSIILLVGQAQKSNPSSTLLKTQDKRITSLSQDIIQVTAKAYEPLLEKYIGKKIVLDVNKGDNEIEFHGILKEYSNDFIEILDITQKKETDIQITSEDKSNLEKYGIVINKNGLRFGIENKGDKPLYIKKVKAIDFTKELNVICNPSSVADFYTEAELSGDISISFDVIRKMDAIIPRKYCLMRHCGE